MPTPVGNYWLGFILLRSRISKIYVVGHLEDALTGYKKSVSQIVNDPPDVRAATDVLTEGVRQLQEMTLEYKSRYDTIFGSNTNWDRHELIERWEITDQRDLETRGFRPVNDITLRLGNLWLLPIGHSTITASVVQTNDIVARASNPNLSTIG